jgi:hypothetical protein
MIVVDYKHICLIYVFWLYANFFGMQDCINWKYHCQIVQNCVSYILIIKIKLYLITGDIKQERKLKAIKFKCKKGWVL